MRLAGVHRVGGLAHHDGGGGGGCGQLGRLAPPGAELGGELGVVGLLRVLEEVQLLLGREDVAAVQLKLLQQTLPLQRQEWNVEKFVQEFQTKTIS